MLHTVLWVLCVSLMHTLSCTAKDDERELLIEKECSSREGELNY